MVLTSFDPTSVAVFRYANIQIDYPSGVSVVGWTRQVKVTFTYALNDASGNEIVSCQETFSFPKPVENLTPARQEAFERLVRHLGLAAGLSYYKLAAPPCIEISDSYSPDGFTPAEIGFHRRLLAKGLGEFSFVNELKAELTPEYSYRGSGRRSPIVGLGLMNGPLVPVGGGKDSCVTIEAFRSAAMVAPELAPTLITVNRYPVIDDVIADAELPDIAVVRTLDPQLRALNALGALNGHVPATAIVSLAVLCAAVLHGHGVVVMSNERSASQGNVTYQGVEINHQWSKSAEAEDLLAKLVADITPELTYFSLLRPLSELAIARRFASTCGRYFDSFSSCNAAFRLDPTRRTSRWCGQCPKCQFVYLALATALERSVLEQIWGADLFETSPEVGFAALLGLRDWKPFECVGEIGECRVALRMLLENDQWSFHPVLLRLRDQVESTVGWSSYAERSQVFAEDFSRLAPEFAAVLAGSNNTPGQTSGQR